MVEKITIGLARMHLEAGEKRDFLPSLVGDMEKRGAKIFLEHGYGSGMGITEDDYLQAAPNVEFVSHEEAFQQQIVIILRCPADEELKLLQPGACLISMLHYPTRPRRVSFLRSLGVEAISLDSISDDSGVRLIESLRTVAWNGLESGFQVLAQTYPSPGLESPDRKPVQVSVIGVGAVGMHAVQAACRYGDVSLWNKMASKGIPGVQVTALEYDLTRQEVFMQEMLSCTDILVDATNRPDQSRIVIPNEWIGLMPEHAVLVDLSVDPYDCSVEPAEVKGIEGIPQGNLDQYIFTPDDEMAYIMVPNCVSTEHRRHAVSCYSWPGIHPKRCMDLYGTQLRPVLRSVLERGGVQNVDPNGRQVERAIGRALLSRWESS